MKDSDRPATMADEKGGSEYLEQESCFDPDDFDGVPAIRVTEAVVQAGVAYLFASGLVHWNEPSMVVRVYVRDLLWELAEASEACPEQTSAICAEPGPPQERLDASTDCP